MRTSKKGFTLLELLVVVTIIVILTGIALPYVSHYADDARYARAKADLEDIKAALALYETKRGEAYFSGDPAIAGPTEGGATSTQKLVDRGYLTKVPADPWGGTYAIYGASGTVMCKGPDGQKCTADDIILPFQPPMSCLSAYWQDGNQDGQVTAPGLTGDTLILTFTRAVKSVAAGYSINLVPLEDVAISPTATKAQPNYGQHYDVSGKQVILSFAAFNPPGPLNLPFQAGQDSIIVNNNDTDLLVDNTYDALTNPTEGKCRKDSIKIWVR